jgi:hypothetical protein
MALIEEYGSAMQKLGRLNAGSLLDSDRKRVLVSACKLIAKIEREIISKKLKKATHSICVGCSCADSSVSYSDWWYCQNPLNFRDFDIMRNGVKTPEWCI